LFVGFAGDLVVGVWVGRDDNKSLGRISGGTVPAQIWRNFMTSALAVDRRRGPELPIRFDRRPERSDQLQSPLPPEWSDSTKQLRELEKVLDDVFG
jgi:penicillin-binding protein 1A